MRKCVYTSPSRDKADKVTPCKLYKHKTISILLPEKLANIFINCIKAACKTDEEIMSVCVYEFALTLKKVNNGKFKISPNVLRFFVKLFIYLYIQLYFQSSSSVLFICINPEQLWRVS